MSAGLLAADSNLACRDDSLWGKYTAQAPGSMNTATYLVEQTNKCTNKCTKCLGTYFSVFYSTALLELYNNSDLKKFLVLLVTK